MSSNGRAGNGRGNRRKKPFRRRGSDAAWQGGENSQGNTSQQGGAYQKSPGGFTDRRGYGQDGGFKRSGEYARGKRALFFERPKWVPPKVNTEPLPVHDCPYCGKTIRDISQAISDRDTGVPVHFDCVTARIAGGESLEKDDTVTYLGGGRFGIVSFGGKDSHSRTGSSDFKVKKIIEWENKDKRAEWRSIICEHYSVT